MVGLLVSQLGETFLCKRMDFFFAQIFADPQPIEHCVCTKKVKTALVVKMSTLACLSQCIKKSNINYYKLMMMNA